MKSALVLKKGGNRGPVLVFKADIFDDSFATICPMGLKSVFEREAGDGYSGRIKRGLQCTKGHPGPVMSSRSRHSVFTVWQGGRYRQYSRSQYRLQPTRWIWQCRRACFTFIFWALGQGSLRLAHSPSPLYPPSVHSRSSKMQGGQTPVFVMSA